MNERSGRRATITDVAQLAKVSTASVSRALSGAKPVSGDVKARVLRAAAELGYAPDEVGRSLRRQQTRTVGLVVANMTNPFFPALVQAVEVALHSAGFGLLLADAGDDVPRELGRVQMLLARRVDALLLTPCDRHRSRSAVQEASSQVPTIQLDRFASRAADYVGMDHEMAVVDLLAHLAETGRLHPVLIGSDPRVSTAWERQRAYVRHAGRFGAQAKERVLVGSFTFDWGAAAAEEALRRWPEADSLVCENDLIALGAIDRLRQLAVKVPEQVAVVGFDDSINATIKEPSLTSVRQPLAEMAQIAVQLISTGDPRRRPVHRELHATVELRNSSAAGQVLPQLKGLVSPFDTNTALTDDQFGTY